MSQENIHKKIGDIAKESSDNESAPRSGAGPAVFYRCTCPECGEDALNLIDSGVFGRSPVFGITSNGEIGCSHTELDGGYELGLFCNDCGHRTCTDYSETQPCNDDFLIQWAQSNGEIHRILPFVCPVCDSHELSRVEIGVEFSTVLVAVCEAVPPDTDPIEAVNHIREISGSGCYRYRCSKGHELAKDDGSPVENAQELVEWLKASQSSNKG